MEIGYATSPLAFPGGTQYLVGVLEPGGRVRIVIQGTPNVFDEGPGEAWRLGHVNVDELRQFVSDAMPVSLKTDAEQGPEMEGVFRVDGPYIHIRILPKEGECHSTLISRDQFKKFTEGILGPVATGGFLY